MKSRTIQVESSAQSNQKYGPYFGLPKIRQKSRKSVASFVTPYSQSIKNIKVNQIRRETGQKQEEIILMKARIHAIKQRKNRLEYKKQKSLTKIQFIQTVRQRKNYQSVQKLREKQKQYQEMDDLKQRAKQLRQGLKKEIQKARETIYMKNIGLAKYQKQLQNGFSSQIMLKQQREQQDKLKKIQKIKQMQKQHSQKLRDFQQSRLREASKNHLTRAEKELTQKQKKQKSLKKLHLQAQKLLQQLKNTQNEYQQVIKANPEVQLYGQGSRVSLNNKMVNSNIREKQLKLFF